MQKSKSKELAEKPAPARDRSIWSGQASLSRFSLHHQGIDRAREDTLTKLEKRDREERGLPEVAKPKQPILNRVDSECDILSDRTSYSSFIPPPPVFLPMYLSGVDQETLRPVALFRPKTESNSAIVSSHDVVRSLYAFPCLCRYPFSCRGSLSTDSRVPALIPSFSSCYPLHGHSRPDINHIGKPFITYASL